MRGLSFFVFMATALLLPCSVISAEETSQDKGLLSFLDFNKDDKSAKNAEAEASEPTETPHQKMLREAESGDVNAQLALGYAFLYGENEVQPDAQKAFYYYNLAAAQNNHVAINNLGSLYYSGIGTDVDVGKAMDMFEKSQQLGNVEAAVNLAFLYMTDNPRSKDSQKAIHYFEEAARGNNPTAQFMLGYSYLRGFIVEKNYGKAFELLQKSAQSQYDEAQYQTALLYMDGKGVPQNYGKAVAFLDAAVAQGHLPAMMKLAEILSEGTKYPRNIYKAHILYNLSSVYGGEKAAEYRDKMASGLKIEDVLQAQAQADKYYPSPSELTMYIRQTFGENITAYIDKYIPLEEEKTEEQKTQTPQKKGGLL